MRNSFGIYLIILALAASAGAQQPASFTLPQAVAIALEKNPGRKLALADVSAAKADVTMSRSAFLPRVDFAETLTKGNDPVYAFGTRLRQGRFTQADFALDRLNYPDAIGNFSSRLGGQWNVFDSFGNRFRFKGAKLAVDSAQQRLTRADQQVIFNVVDAYYGVLLAQRQVEVTEQTVRTAQSLLDSSSAKVEAGTVVQSDALSAQVLLATRKQELIKARGALEIARARLETALGTKLLPDQQLVGNLQERPLPPADLAQAEANAMEKRPDLQAVGSQLEAQRNSVKAAKAAFGPRLDLFASVQADNPSLTSGGNSNWMTGAELRIDLFARDKNARLATEKANLSRAEAQQQMMSDNVRLEIRRSYYDYDSTRQMLEVARTSVAQADESLRIIRDRYESGLVTVTELLRAEDSARSSQMNYWMAVYGNVIGYAALQLATGELNAQSPVVMQ